MNHRLMCSVISMTYDFPSHTGYLYLCSGDCCDMRGCVGLFKAVDPKVLEIICFSGDKPDVQYHKADGKWEVSRLHRTMPRPLKPKTLAAI
jgi:hypothetical protein